MDGNQILFRDQILLPWEDISAVMMRAPLALNPFSNVIISRINSLVLSLNHFREAQGIEGSVNPIIRDWSNSIKHIRPDNKTSYVSKFYCDFRYERGIFYFDRNKVFIFCKKDTNNINGIDSNKLIIEEISEISDQLGLEFNSKLENNSIKSARDHVVLYHISRFGSQTSGSVIRFYDVIDGVERLVDPPAVKFVVLDEAALYLDISDQSFEALINGFSGKSSRPDHPP